MQYRLLLKLKEVINRSLLELYTGNLMMHGQQFHGLVLTILEDGNLFNIWLKDYILTLVYFTLIKKE